MAKAVCEETMQETKLATAQKLARAHFRVDPNLKHVYLLEPVNEQDRRDPIKLLEVVEGTLEGEITPVGFAPDPDRGIDYPVVIVEMSPREYRELAGKKLFFRQQDWTVGQELSA